MLQPPPGTWTAQRISLLLGLQTWLKGVCCSELALGQYSQQNQLPPPAPTSLLEGDVFSSPQQQGSQAACPLVTLCWFCPLFHSASPPEELSLQTSLQGYPTNAPPPPFFYYLPLVKISHLATLKSNILKLELWFFCFVRGGTCGANEKEQEREGESTNNQFLLNEVTSDFQDET